MTVSTFQILAGFYLLAKTGASVGYDLIMLTVMLVATSKPFEGLHAKHFAHFALLGQEASKPNQLLAARFK